MVDNMKKLALLLHHAGTAPDLIYPSLKSLNNVEIITFYIKSKTNFSLNKVYDETIGTIGPGFECSNEMDLLEKVKQYHDQYHIDGVLTFAEMLVKYCNEINHYIGNPFMSEETIIALQNKKNQRNILKNNNIPIPKFFEISNEHDLEKAAEHIGFPSLLKPNYGGGGYGILLVENLDELRKAYYKEGISYQNIILEGVATTFNLEEYMIGENWNSVDALADYCSVESIIQNGEIHHIGISDRTKLVSPFRESGYIIPTSLEQEKVSEIESVATEALKALGVNNIVTHTEIKFTSEGPKIIEINGRPGGTVPFRLKNATCGEYDLFVEMAKLSLGIPVNTKVNYKKYAASKVVHCPEGIWKIKKVDFKNLEEIKSITLLIPIRSAGDIVDSYNGIEDLICLSYLENENVIELVNDMYKIDREIRIQYESL